MEQYNYQQYIGRKIRGFPFTGHPDHTSLMKQYDGKEGIIIACRNIFVVRFSNGVEWNYPLALGLCYIANENGHYFCTVKRNVFDYFDKIKKL